MRKVCIITGANSGIGKQAALQIAQQGWHVVMACRSLEGGQKALEDLRSLGAPDIELMQLDTSLVSSIDSFTDEVRERFPAVDALIHNAARFDLTKKKPEFTAEGYESIWMTNHIGPVHLTCRLMDQLRASDGGRVITVASKGLVMMPNLKIDFDDPEFKNRRFSPQRAYYQSKLAQVMFTYWMAGQLRGTAVTAYCVRVTNVKVDLSRYPDLSRIRKFAYAQKSKFSISPAEMAKTYTHIATSPALSNASGLYFDENNRPVKSSKYSYDNNNIEALMELTRKYIRLPDCAKDCP